jgi:type I site-specific restriction-modification system R (restriction) subunit
MGGTWAPPKSIVRELPWRTISGREDAPPGLAGLQVVLEGVFERRRFLDLVRDVIVFEDFGGGKLAKKTVGYHRFHAGRVAVEETPRRCWPPRTGTVGLFAAAFCYHRWHASPHTAGGTPCPSDDEVG